MRSAAAPAPGTRPVRLHIGGQAAHPDWKILNVEPGPHVDYVGHCGNLSAFGSASISEIYASHVLEHLGYVTELGRALREFHRVLIPGGVLQASVPDLATLCTLFIDPAFNTRHRFQLMKMMFGGQLNEADFHQVGLNEEFLTIYLQEAGFIDIVRVDNFGLFEDMSSLAFKGTPISLNMRARKPPAD